VIGAWSLGPTSRLNVPASTILDASTCDRFSAIAHSTNAVPFFVERSLYWNAADGTPWDDGSNARAVALGTVAARPYVSALVRGAMSTLAALREEASMDPPTAAQAFHVYVEQPTILRQQFELSAVRPGRATLVVPVRHDAGLGVEARFDITVAVNGLVLTVIPAAELTQSWSVRLIAVPDGLLREGTNEATLDVANVSPEAPAVIYASSVQHGVSCQSTNGGVFWDCWDPAPTLQDGRGFTYDIRLEFAPTIDTVEPAWRFLLNADRFSLLHFDQAYAWAHVGPYYLDPANTRHLERLARLDLRGDDDYATARNIMEFLHRALNYPRATSSDESAYTKLIEVQGAWCTGNATSFVALAALHGIDARLVGLVFDTVASGQDLGHVVAEAWIGGRWVMFDPFANVTVGQQGDDWMPYGVMDIAAARPGLEDVAVADLRTTPQIGRGPRDTFGELHMDWDAFGRPIPYAGFFNARAVVHAGPFVLPYYSTHRPPSAP
jgi:hypothetical protein